MSIPEPTAGLIISAVKTAGSGAWKLWNSHLASKETGELLRAALAWALCPARQEDQDVQKLAASLEERLRKTAAPRDKPGVLERAKGLVRRVVPWRVRGRQRPEAEIFGTSFQEHLEEWLRLALARHPDADDLVAIECPGHAGGADAVVTRFPAGFQVELLREEGDASNFRKELAKEVLSAHRMRKDRITLHAAAKRALLTGAEAVAPGGVAFGVAEAAGSDHPTAIAVGLGVAALGALAGSVTGDMACKVAAQQSAVRGMALAWIAELVGALSGERPSPDPDVLQTALLATMRVAAAGKMTWPESVDGPLAALRDLRRLAKEAHDNALERAITEVEDQLREAEESRLHRLSALGALIDLYNVSAGPEELVARSSPRAAAVGT